MTEQQEKVKRFLQSVGIDMVSWGDFTRDLISIIDKSCADKDDELQSWKKTAEQAQELWQKKDSEIAELKEHYIELDGFSHATIGRLTLALTDLSEANKRIAELEKEVERLKEFEFMYNGLNK